MKTNELEIISIANECLQLISGFDENHKWHIGYKIEKILDRKEFNQDFLNFLIVIKTYLLDPSNEEKKTNMQIAVYGDDRTTLVYKDFEGNYVGYFGYNEETCEHVLYKENKWFRGAKSIKQAEEYVNEVNTAMGYKAIQYVEEVTCAIK